MSSPEPELPDTVDTRWMSVIPVTRLTAQLLPEIPWAPPPDLAVTLRGALGAAVMDIACTREHRTCEGCDVAARCAIPGWYDPGRAGGNRHRPFALNARSAPVDPATPLVFDWIWTGTVPRPSLLLEALFRATAKGLGSRRIPHRVHRVQVQGRDAAVVVVRDGEQGGDWPEPATLGSLVRVPPPDRIQGADVHLVSRARLGSEPSTASFLDACVRRVRQLQRELLLPRGTRHWPTDLPGTWLHRADETSERWSKRQQTRIDLSGTRGTVRFGPEVRQIADLLAAAEVLQVGPGTSSGLGCVRVDWKLAPAASVTAPSQAPSSPQSC